MKRIKFKQLKRKKYLQERKNKEFNYFCFYGYVTQFTDNTNNANKPLKIDYFDENRNINRF